MAEGTKPEPKPAKCVPLPGKEDLNEKTKGSNGTGHSLDVLAQVAKIDLLLEVGNIWDPEKRTMGQPLSRARRGGCVNYHGCLEQRSSCKYFNVGAPRSLTHGVLQQVPPKITSYIAGE